MFESLGVTETTIRVYRVLLEQPELTAAQLTAEIGQPGAAVARSLEQLRELGLLIPRWTGGENHGVEYAVHPNVGFALLSQKRKEQIDQMAEELRRDELRADVVVEQYADFLRQRTNRDLEIVEGQERAHQRMGEFRPRKSLWALNDMSAITNFGEPEDSPDKGLLELSLDYRVIYRSSIVNAKRLLEYIRWMNGYGAQVRASPSLPMRLLIYDGESVVMALDPDNHSAGLVVHHSKAVITLATALFERYWLQATDVLAAQDTVDDQPSPQELELLQLLVQGATDEQAGRKLGVSLRTVRRMAAKLSDQTGASGRFELGVRAAQRGWVR